MLGVWAGLCPTPPPPTSHPTTPLPSPTYPARFYLHGVHQAAPGVLSETLVPVTAGHLAPVAVQGCPTLLDHLHHPRLRRHHHLRTELLPAPHGAAGTGCCKSKGGFVYEVLHPEWAPSAQCNAERIPIRCQHPTLAQSAQCNVERIPVRRLHPAWAPSAQCNVERILVRCQRPAWARSAQCRKNTVKVPTSSMGPKRIM